MFAPQERLMALERDVEIQDEQERQKAKAKMLQATEAEAENTNNKPINEAMLVRLGSCL